MLESNAVFQVSLLSSDGNSHREFNEITLGDSEVWYRYNYEQKRKKTTTHRFFLVFFSFISEAEFRLVALDLFSRRWRLESCDWSDAA